MLRKMVKQIVTLKHRRQISKMKAYLVSKLNNRTLDEAGKDSTGLRSVLHITGPRATFAIK